MKNLKSTILLQRQVIQYARLAAEVVAQEGERKFQEKIRKNGFHPEIKRYFESFFPESDMKLNKFP